MEQGHGTMNRIGRPILAASVGITARGSFKSRNTRMPNHTELVCRGRKGGQ